GTPAATPDLTAEWQHFVPELEAFQQSDWTPVLTHHDLIPENIIDDGQRLYIVDWEYAALGHPQLDWCCISGDKTQPVSKVIDWINRLWWLLNDSSGRFNT
ncbi:MAG: phosphotransferase, partial [Pseudomonadales bacterium]